MIQYITNVTKWLYAHSVIVHCMWCAHLYDDRQQLCANRHELVQLLERRHDTLYGDYGVIVFLYSLLLTKVVDHQCISVYCVFLWSDLMTTTVCLRMF